MIPYIIFFEIDFFFTQSSFRKLFKLVHVSIIHSLFFDSMYITSFGMKVWPTLHTFCSFLRHKLSLVHTVCCQMKESKHQLPLKMQSSLLHEIPSPGLPPGRRLRLDKEISSASFLTLSLWPAFLGSPIWMDGDLWQGGESGRETSVTVLCK